MYWYAHIFFRGTYGKPPAAVGCCNQPSSYITEVALLVAAVLFLHNYRGFPRCPESARNSHAHPTLKKPRPYVLSVCAGWPK